MAKLAALQCSARTSFDRLSQSSKDWSALLSMEGRGLACEVFLRLGRIEGPNPTKVNITLNTKNTVTFFGVAESRVYLISRKIG